MITMIERSILTWLSGISGIPEVVAEAMSKKNGVLALRMRSVPEDRKRYENGSFVRRAEFELRIRATSTDTASRLNAIHTLETVGVMCRQSLPSLEGDACAFEAGIKSIPVLENRTDNGDDEYMATYYILYTEGIV